MHLPGTQTMQNTIGLCQCSYDFFIIHRIHARYYAHVEIGMYEAN